MTRSRCCARSCARRSVEELVLFTSEHWTNFFLDHIGAFCIGRADGYRGPVEPWLNVPREHRARGSGDLAAAIVEAAYDGGFEPSFAYELQLDHGTMIPLHFLTPEMDVPAVPIFINTLASPQPSARRCLAFGQRRRRGAARLGAPDRRAGHRRDVARSRRAPPRDHRPRLRPPFPYADGERRRCRRSPNIRGNSSVQPVRGRSSCLTWIALCGATGGSAGERPRLRARRPVGDRDGDHGVRRFRSYLSEVPAG